MIQESLNPVKHSFEVAKIHCNYEYITTYRQVAKFVNYLNLWLYKCKREPVIAIDTETTGLDPHSSKLILLQIAIYINPDEPGDGISCYIFDIQKLGTDVLKKLEPVLNYSRGEKVKARKLGHYIKFDWKMLYANGLKLKQRLVDTQICEAFLAKGTNNYSSLADLSKKYLNLELDKTLQKSNWGDGITEEQLRYAAMDACVLLPLYDRLRLEIEFYLKEHRELYLDEIHSIIPIAQMEYSGMLIDFDKWQELEVKLTDDKERLKTELKSKLGDINFNSPKQLLKAFADIGVDLPGTSKQVLAPMSSDHDGLKTVLDYRAKEKLLSSFIKPLPDKVNRKTGRIHPTINQYGCVTGRFSSNAPNLQQIPKRDSSFRKCFVAAAGYKLVRADFAQLELKIVARAAPDIKMIQAFRNGIDIHTLTASLILNKALEDISSQDRRIAKSANFGLIYGMGADSYKNYAEVNYGVKLTDDEAYEFRGKFLQNYLGIFEWHEETKKAFKKFFDDHNYYVAHTFSGRQCLIKDKSVTKALNYPIQGTGADCTKRALRYLDFELENNKLYYPECKLLNVVHDEIVLEVREELADPVGKILKNCMEKAGDEIINKGVEEYLIIPIVADLAVTNTWGDEK